MCILCYQLKKNKNLLYHIHSEIKQRGRATVLNAYVCGILSICHLNINIFIYNPQPCKNLPIEMKQINPVNRLKFILNNIFAPIVIILQVDAIYYIYLKAFYISTCVVHIISSDQAKRMYWPRLLFDFAHSRAHTQTHDQ